MSSVALLHRQWDWWFDGAVKRGASAAEYAKSVKHLGSFATVQVCAVRLLFLSCLVFVCCTTNARCTTGIVHAAFAHRASRAACVLRML